MFRVSNIMFQESNMLFSQGPKMSQGEAETKLGTAWLLVPSSPTPQSRTKPSERCFASPQDSVFFKAIHGVVRRGSN